MLQPLDILHKIACRMYGYSGMDGATAIEEFMAVHQQDFSVSITNDLERSERWFLARCGQGDTFYFSVQSYEEGRTLAADLLLFLQGEQLDTGQFTGQQFHDGTRLYLFVHVRHSPIRRPGTRGTQEWLRSAQ